MQRPTREDHFKDTLLHYFGKQPISWNEETLNRILKDLAHEKVSSPTPLQVKKSLTRLGLQKYYKDIYLMSEQLGWTNPLSSSGSCEEKLQELMEQFQKIHKVYRYVIKKIDPNRQSFISYKYILR